MPVHLYDSLSRSQQILSQPADRPFTFTVVARPAAGPPT